MFLLHYGYILDHGYGIKKHDHEITMGNHAELWKNGFRYSWEGFSMKNCSVDVSAIKNT